MDPEQIDRLIDLVVTIGGQMASDGFAIAMRRVMYQAYVDFFWAMFAGVVSLGLMYAALVCKKKHLECKDAGGYYDDEWLIGCWGLRAFAMIILVMSIGAVLGGLDRLMNPEWHAVQMLMGLL